MPYSSSASYASTISRRPSRSSSFGSNALPSSVQSQYANLINNPEMMKQVEELFKSQQGNRFNSHDRSPSPYHRSPSRNRSRSVHSHRSKSSHRHRSRSSHRHRSRSSHRHRSRSSHRRSFSPSYRSRSRSYHRSRRNYSCLFDSSF